MRVLKALSTHNFALTDESMWLAMWHDFHRSWFKALYLACSGLAAFFGASGVELPGHLLVTRIQKLAESSCG